MSLKKKLVRITTVPVSLDKLLEDQLKFMNNHYHVIAISSNGAELKKIGFKEGVDTYCVEMTRKMTPIKDLISVLKLVFFLNKVKPDIVHTHTPKAGTVGMLAAKITGVPIRLHTVAGLPLLETVGLKRLVLNFVEKLTYKCATKIYPNSVGLQAIIEEENFAKPSKLKIIGNGSSNGINTLFFNKDVIDKIVTEKLKDEFGILEKDFVFIYVGRIVGDKGINELVESFNLLNMQFDNIKLLLVGPFEDNLDPIKTESKKIIDKNKNIFTTGFVMDVRPYFALSDILVFPSYREGFPNVVMQAGAMGLPSIVTNINGCNEIIIEDLNGKIIPVKDMQALHNTMKYFLLNTEKYFEMKKSVRDIIVNKYERNIFLNDLVSEYKSLVKE